MRQQFDAAKKNFHIRKGQADMLRQTIKSEQDRSASFKSSLAVEAEVLKLLQAVSASTWTNTKNVVESIVTRALQAIFYDKSYKFVLNQEIKRNVPSVTFSILDEGMELDIIDEVGGGIADVVALVLRVAFLVLYRPKMRQLLILDEPAKHLSTVYQPYAARFLKQICSELGVTIICVTHQSQFAEEADQTFRIVKNGKLCEVR